MFSATLCPPGYVAIVQYSYSCTRSVDEYEEFVSPANVNVCLSRLRPVEY